MRLEVVCFLHVDSDVPPEAAALALASEDTADVNERRHFWLLS
jgi:hypothetical protein